MHFYRQSQTDGDAKPMPCVFGIDRGGPPKTHQKDCLNYCNFVFLMIGVVQCFCMPEQGESSIISRLKAGLLEKSLLTMSGRLL